MSSLWRWFGIPFGSLGISLMSGALYASELEETELLRSLSLQDLLALPVKSATLTELDAASVPSSVTLFHHQQFEQMGVDYLHELVNFVPGFQAFRQGEAGNEYYHSVRGRRTGSSSREVLVLVDGVRQNRSFDSALSVPMMLLDGIEKVEFIRGPGSALYGSNAFMGVIDITTLKQVNKLSVVANADSLTSVAMMTTAIGGWQLDARLGLISDSGQAYSVGDSFSGLPITVSDPNTGLGGELHFSTGSTTFRVGGDKRDSESFFLLESSGEGVNRIENDYAFAAIEHQWSPADELTLRFVGGYSQASYGTRSLIAPEGALVGVSQPVSTEAFVAKSNQEERVTSGEIHMDWRHSERVSTQSGVEWRNGRFSHLTVHNNYDLEALVAGEYPVTYFGDFSHYTLVYPSQGRDMAALYAQSQVALSRTWKLTLGGRYDSYSSNGSAFSPRVGIIRELGVQHSVKLLYGAAFRAPSMNEVAPENNSVLLGNPDLAPEKIHTLEAVWVKGWQAGQVSVSVFENRFYDAIVQETNVQVGRGFTNSNNRGRSQGAELEYTQQLAASLSVRGTATRIWSQLESEYRQASTFGSLVTHYQKGDWGVNIGWVYSGERSQLTPTGERLTLDAYHWLTAKVHIQPNSRYKIWLQAKNAMDEQFLTPSQADGLPYGLPNRGRELSLGASLAF